MAVCRYCQQRKGKRSCPALGGTICTMCCGQHRLKEIDCPLDCTYLGGLAIVRDPAKATAGFTEADHDAIWEKLRAYAQGASGFRNDALVRCFDGATDPDRWEIDLATGYVYYGHRDAGGRRLVDHVLAARGRGLSAGEAAAVVAVQNAWASLFEVVSVQAGIGLELRDLLSGEIVAVREVLASAQLKRSDVMFTWLMAVSDHVELTGAGCVVPRPHVGRVREALDAELPHARSAWPGVPDRALMGSIAWVALRELRDAFHDVRMPVLHTTDGEELVRCQARYSVEDEAAVRALAPDDDARALVGQYLQDHYRRWLDAPLPALDGKTPRNAARTRQGRVQVDALLEDIEHSSLAMPGGEAIDFAALRREFALDPADEPAAELAYDAARVQEPAAWLGMGDTVKVQAVEHHHRSLTAHPDIPDANLHALMHVIVENQLAGGDPPEVQATLARLSQAGLTRHEAIHAIGSVVAEAIFNIVKTKTAFDRGAAARALSRLKPESWRFTLPR